MSTTHCISAPIDQEPFYQLPFEVLSAGGRITLRYENDKQKPRSVGCYGIDIF
jgi:hypothetical protein